MTVIVKVDVFCGVALCCLVDIYQRFRGARCTDDGGSKLLSMLSARHHGAASQKMDIFKW
jgi:hypothetical protein